MPQARTLTPQDIERVLAYIKTKPNAQRNRAMFLLTVWAGFRVSEVAGLKISDVRNADGTIRSEIYLEASRVKHGHAGVVYLNERLQRELEQYVNGKRWYEPDQSLFTTQAKPRKGFSANTMTQTFYYLYRGAGIYGGSSHSGRRTALSSMADKAINIKIIATIAGHSDIRTTSRYLSVTDRQLRNAIELV